MSARNAPEKLGKSKQPIQTEPNTRNDATRLGGGFSCRRLSARPARDEINRAGAKSEAFHHTRSAPTTPKTSDV
jgi:hypothetical protein